MKHLVLDLLEFSLNTCIKTFLIQGGQSSFKILAQNSYENVIDEVSDLIERGIAGEVFDIDFCKELMRVYGYKPNIEKFIKQQDEKNSLMARLGISRDIVLNKPL